MIVNGWLADDIVGRRRLLLQWLQVAVTTLEAALDPEPALPQQDIGEEVEELAVELEEETPAEANPMAVAGLPFELLPSPRRKRGQSINHSNPFHLPPLKRPKPEGCSNFTGPGSSSHSRTANASQGLAAGARGADAAGEEPGATAAMSMPASGGIFDSSALACGSAAPANAGVNSAEGQKVDAAEPVQNEFLIFKASALEFFLELKETANKAAKSMPAALAERFPPVLSTKELLHRKIKWDPSKGYVGFLTTPKKACKGHAHVSMLDYDENAFHGKGLFVEDAFDVLSALTVDSTWPRLVVCPSGSPRADAGGRGMFGWAFDGALANGTRGFASFV